MKKRLREIFHLFAHGVNDLSHLGVWLYSKRSCPNDRRRIMPFFASVPFSFLARKYALENSLIVCRVPLKIFFKYPLSLKAGTCGN